ncbi:hypothetical protein [Glaciibacter psychrotolerans]|uniref:Uncharacterized protein n=1 Tax=Glaciibacter psychrotolerans TaxID=670054 RepID=A0A7Z0EBI0_9MICO|nr:hypothetical protein [Leifsonia psychrotolerans]NYJ18478.1 hypothetical protein [Leifsonia psychrotolerans]
MTADTSHSDGGGDLTPETVSELTGQEGGMWVITTFAGTTHFMNLDRGTVRRRPAPGRTTSINDVERPLRTLDACRVGEVGRWTMLSDDFFTDYYWHQTSTIVRIERSDNDQPQKPSTEQ